jgi:hypothetical protein
MHDEAARAGRDPNKLELTLGHAVAKIDADRSQKLADMGADRVVLAMPPLTDIDQARDTLSECAQRLALSP